MFTAEEIKIANATSRSAGASVRNSDGTIRAVVPKYVESIARKEDTILDYGAGKGAVHTLYLRDNGFDCTAYDFGDNVMDVHDRDALEKQYDIVFASNVLNVCSSTRMLTDTIEEIYNATKENGIAIMNYPSSPRKTSLGANSVQCIIEHVFKSKIKLVGGTTKSPLWVVKNEIVGNKYKVILKNELIEIESRYKIYKRIEKLYNQHKNIFIGDREVYYDVYFNNENDVYGTYKTLIDARRFAKKL